MFDSIDVQRRIGRFAWAMAWFGLVAGQFHAMARHNTVDGHSDLDYPMTAFWSDPGRELFAPLLEWGTADQVYLTYGKLWFPVFLAFTLCAFAVRSRRSPVGLEKWGWRIALTGYVWATASVFADYWLQWGSHANDTLLDIAFIAGIPGLLIMLVGSTVLGIALLRRGFRPRISAWLLTLVIPFMFAIEQVTSMGSIALPVMFAFGIMGRRLGSEPPGASTRESADESLVRGRG